MTEGRGSVRVRTDVCAQACACVSAVEPTIRAADWLSRRSVSSQGCGRGSAEGQGPQGRAVPRWDTHGRALLILEHNLELGLDLSWDDGREDDRHSDRAEGANLTLCVLRGKRPVSLHVSVKVRPPSSPWAAPPPQQ